MKLEIKINDGEKEKILKTQQFNHSIYYKLDYLVYGKLVTQSHELLYEYLKKFHELIVSLNNSKVGFLKSIGGIVDIEVTRNSNRSLHIEIITEKTVNQKISTDIFELKINYNDLRETYLNLLMELSSIASKINFDLKLDDLERI